MATLIKSSVVGVAGVASGRKVGAVTCVCDLRKKHEPKVNSLVKENLNKVMAIGSTDFKMLYEIVKDLDEMHKKKVDEITKKNKDGAGAGDKPSALVAIDEDGEEDTNENIFLDDDKK